MALSNEQKTEVSRLFLVAFNATPGVYYMNLVDSVVNAGASLRDIALAIPTLDQFKETYPTFLSNDQFASRLVNNLVGTSASDAAKAQAVLDATSSLNAGASRGELILALSNVIAKISPTDPNWGGLARQVDNQLAASDYYTSVLLQGSTNLVELRSVVANITSTQPGSSRATVSFDSASLSESDSNNGSFSTPVTLSLLGDRFNGANGTEIGTVENLPTGLTARLVKINDATVQLSLSGAATSHSSLDTISSVRVTFDAEDLVSGLIPSNNSSLNLTLNFQDVWPRIEDDRVTIDDTPTAELLINLSGDAKAITHAGVLVNVSSDALELVTDANLTGVPMATEGEAVGSVRFLGGQESNDYQASPLGDHITPGGGSDTLTLGAGTDTVVFSTPGTVGVILITGFTPGADGDVLDFSRILGTSVTDSIEDYIDTNIAASSAASWDNGSVLLALTEEDADATDVAALFGSSSYLAAPATAKKAVVLTADVTGMTKIWSVINKSGAGVTTIASSEISLIGMLTDVNNFELAGFDPANFL